MLNPILEPVVNDAITCWSKWKNPSQADAVRKLGPALESVCLSVQVPIERATEWLQAQSTESITAEAIREFVRSTTEIPAEDLQRMKAHTNALLDEPSRPATARELVIEERCKPLADRSRSSIEAELFEIRTGRIRLASANDNGDWAGEKLPDEVWGNIAGSFGPLQDEL